MNFDMKDKDRSTKIKDLISYFNSDEKKDLNDTKYARAIKLEKMINIYNSDLIDIRKLVEMQSVYSNCNKFIVQFKDLERYSDDAVVGYYVDMVEKIGKCYEELEQKHKESAKELIELENNGFFEFYYCACDFVLEYVNFNDSPYFTDYLKKAQINEVTFNNFLDIVCYFNADLYKKYEEKQKYNKDIIKCTTMEKMNRLRNGIINGVNEDGEKFDCLDGIKNLPFWTKDIETEVIGLFGLKNASTFSVKLRLFFEKVMPENAKEVVDYILKNNLLGLSSTIYSPKLITEDEIYQTSYSINGVPLTTQDKDAIINYMKENEIPFLLRAFNIVKDRYLNNELELTKGKVLKK